MKLYLLLTFIFISLVNLSTASTVFLKGTVKENNGKVLSNVTISLAKLKSLSTVTDSLGNFSIAGTSIRENHSRLAYNEKITLIFSGENITLTLLQKQEAVRVDIFAANSKRIFSSVILNKKYTIPSNILCKGINILTISTNHRKYSYPIIYSEKKFLLKKSSLENSFMEIKIGEVKYIDTLIATRQGYITAKIPIDNYVKENILIIMQKESAELPLPLVYDKEHTGVDCPKPPLPSIEELPSIKYLPDPFEWSDKSRGRIKTIAEWRCRRAEIIEEIMHYGIGYKPPKPEKFEAKLEGNIIKITVGVGSNTINLSATISKPSNAPKDKPIPAIIGINTPTGSLPSSVFSSRGIATITFNASQLTGDAFSGGYKEGNFYKLYPNTDAGYMVRWAWGVSRIIDALEILPEAYIDLKRIAVSGCSYQGKIALYAGALDERIALTIPQESGGGGTISWRYSEMLEQRDKTEVENLRHAQGAAWYSNTLRQFTTTPDKLPYDHHELIALCAPRAILCIESSAIARMGAEAARIDALAARKVYTALGIPDRMGAVEENTNHCVWHNGFTSALEAFVDKFLLGKENVNTDILKSKFTTIDEKTWIPWEIPELK
ncbi:MAG: carboxypeptidase-like regulatory domain-containing protein [Chitinispirillaceae bacterium]|nr:carboxypeptidase-like regulatory domain-containing protein [Chitinispirillaceae bacterium]